MNGDYRTDVYRELRRDGCPDCGGEVEVSFSVPWPGTLYTGIECQECGEVYEYDLTDCQEAAVRY